MSRPKWKDWTPRLGSSTQLLDSAAAPTAGNNTAGRYLWLPDQRLVVADFIVTVTAGGSGTDGYVMSLPIKARRHLSFTSFDQNVSNLGQQDRPIGTAWCSRFLQLRGRTVIATLCDVPPLGQDRDSWVQFFASGQTCSGSSTITSGNTTVAVSFGTTYLAAPTAADIQIQYTNNPTTKPTGFPWITNITTTGFTLNVATNPSTSGLTFDWKCISDQTIFVNSQAPFAWGTLGDGLYGKVIYEPAAG